MIILPAQLSELTGSSQANSTGSSVANSSPGSTQTRQTSNKDTINHVQAQTIRCNDDMLCGMRCGMRNARYDKKCMNLASTWNSKGATGIWEEIAWKRYKDHRNRSYGLEMASVLRYDTGLRFTTSRHLNATKRTCYSHQTWKQNTWQWCTQDGWQNTSTEP